MKYIKKVAVTELVTNTGTIIDSMTSGDDPHTNAPSIYAVKAELNKKLNNHLFIFNKNIQISTANTWYDTGIIGSDLADGTYVMEVFTESYSVNSQYSERLSGIVAWYAGKTNSTNADTIPLSKAGHARNNHNIQLRILRTSGSVTPLKLQITDDNAWSGAGDVKFAFVKLI